jgi:predicted AlkP superfamily phosphohydrolase/phosphomutase
MKKNRTKSRKIFVLGLDGATFDVLKPLIDAGHLPNLAGLIEEGASGVLNSVFPPVTRPAWFCLATGLTPDSTSLFDHTAVLGPGYRLSQASHISYRGRSVWDALSRAGKKVHILAYPWLYPAYPINGVMLSGMGGVWEGKSVYPESFRSEARSILGEDPMLVVPYHDRKYEDAGLFLRDMRRSLSQKVRLAESLITGRDWDLIWLVFSESDWLQHRLWHAFQPQAGQAGKGSEALSPLFDTGWREIDEAVGRLLGLLDGDTDVLVVSDHGFGPNSHVFKINAWLRERGYLREKSTIQTSGALAGARIYRWLRGLGAKLRLARFDSLYQKGKTLAKNIGRDDVAGLIDLEKSQVFDPGHTNPTAILYINQNIERRSPAFSSLMSDLERELGRLQETTGLEVTWRKPAEGGRWLGDKVLVPDFVVMMEDGGCVFDKTDLKGPLLLEQPYSSRHTGSHRTGGLFIFRSREKVSGRVGDLSVADIVPTLLYAYQMPVPKRLPGRVVQEFFSEEWIKGHPLRWVDEQESKIPRADGLSEEEEKALKDQLKGLGYF